eukprot:scaffold204311_cov58-Attheya_sp.AAC.2
MPAADITWHTQTQVIEIKPDANAVPPPLFNLVPWNYRWRNGKGRIETTMMKTLNVPQVTHHTKKPYYLKAVTRKSLSVDSSSQKAFT